MSSYLAAESQPWGGSLLATLLSLALVCGLAWVVLRWLSGRTGGRSDRGLQVVARCALEPRRSLYVVRAAGRILLIGSGEGGLALLTELDAEAFAAQAGEGRLAGAAGRTRFADALARAWASRASPSAAAPDEEPAVQREAAAETKAPERAS